VEIHQEFKRRGRDATLGFAGFAGKALDKVIDKIGNLFLALAQGRDADGTTLSL